MNKDYAEFFQELRKLCDEHRAQIYTYHDSLMFIFYRNDSDILERTYEAPGFGGSTFDVTRVERTSEVFSTYSVKEDRKTK